MRKIVKCIPYTYDIILLLFEMCFIGTKEPSLCSEKKEIEMNENYGEQVKSYRIDLGLTQSQVAAELEVTPGYISNVENGRTAMSLRILIYYARLMNVSLDELVGKLEPEYKKSALDNALLKEISKMDDSSKEKLLKTLKIWNKK